MNGEIDGDKSSGIGEETVRQTTSSATFLFHGGQAFLFLSGTFTVSTVTATCSSLHCTVWHQVLSLSLLGVWSTLCPQLLPLLHPVHYISWSDPSLTVAMVISEALGKGLS